jgi:hypothetical protein
MGIGQEVFSKKDDIIDVCYKEVMNHMILLQPMLIIRYRPLMSCLHAATLRATNEVNTLILSFSEI